MKAEAIYQANLDGVSHALWNGDLALMLNHVALPNVMKTADAEFVVASKEELLILMDDFRASMITKNANRYERRCLTASPIQGDSGVIVGWHDTRIMLDETEVVPAFLNQMVLVKIDGLWRGCHITADIKNVDMQILSPDLVESQKQSLAELGIRYNNS